MTSRPRRRRLRSSTKRRTSSSMEPAKTSPVTTRSSDSCRWPDDDRHRRRGRDQTPPTGATTMTETPDEWLERPDKANRCGEELESDENLGRVHAGARYPVNSGGP